MAKLTKDELYWQKRNEELEAEWFRRSQKEIERELAAYYTQALKHIEKDINDLYARFAIDNSMSMTAAYSLLQGDEFRVWRMDMQEYLKQIEATGDKKLLRELNTLAMRSRISRLDKLYAETCVELSKLAEKFGRSMDKFLPTAYKDFYYRNLFEIGKKRGLASTPAKVESSKLEDVLRAPWSGKNYSARIWANQEKLAEILHREITSAMHRGVSVENVSKIITQKMGVGMSDARRLVRTELNYVQNRAALDSIKDAGMKYYRFVATLDRRTSAACRAHDGKIYPVDEGSPGTNMPPLHPHCRSTIVGSLKGDSIPKGNRAARIDSHEYILVPASMSYTEWYQRYVNASSEQYYKKVTLSFVKEEVLRPTGIVKFRQVTTQPNVHVADGITFKPKQLHELQQRLRGSASVIGIDDLSVLPPVYVATETQMGTNAPALYNWRQDKVFITLSLLDEEKLAGLQRDGVLPENRLSTMVHELIHWKDAVEYRKQYPDMAGYADWIKQRCKKKIDNLVQKGYNINVSKYATDSMDCGDFDEVYTEYRTLYLLTRGEKHAHHPS